MNAKRTRNYYDMFAIMFNSQKSYRKYIENTHLGLLTETHEYYFGSLKHQIFIYSRWRHPPKTISPRPYCRSRRGRNGLGSETTLGPISCKNLKIFKKNVLKTYFSQPFLDLATLHIPYVTNTPANRCHGKVNYVLNAIFKVCKISKAKRRN